MPLQVKQIGQQSGLQRAREQYSNERSTRFSDTGVVAATSLSDQRDQK